MLSSDKESVSYVQPLILHVVSRQSGKPALADVANHFLQQAQLSKGRKSPPEVTVNEITDLLEGKYPWFPCSRDCLLMTIFTKANTAYLLQT